MIIVQIAGRLGKDAESRFTPGGQKVTTLTLATNIRKGGKEETVWWRVTIWGDRYDKMMPYFKKGAALVVIGDMNKPEIWTDREGKPQVSCDMTADIIRFNPFGGSGGERNPQEGGAGNQSNPSSHTGYSNPSSQAGFSNQSSQGSYGGGMDDFGSSHGGGSHYSQSQHADESIPF